MPDGRPIEQVLIELASKHAGAVDADYDVTTVGLENLAKDVMTGLLAVVRDRLDEMTKLLFEADSAEDPFCCVPLRHKIINQIRKELSLEELKES